MYILSQGQFKWYIDESLNKGGNLGQANMIKFFIYLFIYLFFLRTFILKKERKSGTLM